MPLDEDALESLRINRQQDYAEPPKRRRIPPWIVFSIIGVLGLMTVAFFVIPPAGAIDVTTAPVQSGSGSGSPAVLNASGYVVARRQATVSAKITGKVSEVLVEEGATVEDGGLLARLDDSSVRPRYLVAQREVESAKSDLDEINVRLADARKTLARMQSLRAEKLISEAQLDAATAEVNSLAARLAALHSRSRVTEAELRARAQELEDLQVRAPFKGVVVSKDAQPGEMVSPVSAGGGFTRTGIATIVDMESREIEVDVNESFINRVRAGQRTKAVLDAYPDWNIASHVINIVPTADRQKATVRVRIAFDQLDERILPDMAVKVAFLEDAKPDQAAQLPSRARVPASALVDEGSMQYVWRVRGNTVERATVRTLSSKRDGMVEIAAGVNPGDVVVIEPLDELKDGMRIKARG
jgi:RND family efflux transporter MFP subunit